MSDYDKDNVIQSRTKVRNENGKNVTYVITNDSFNDDYGSYQGQYHAWRIEEGKEPERLTSNNYYNSQTTAEDHITFGKYVNCPTCGHRHFEEEK